MLTRLVLSRSLSLEQRDRRRTRGKERREECLGVYCELCVVSSPDVGPLMNEHVG